jgi:hypothetical protein
MWIGAAVGAVVGFGLMLGVALPGVPWLFALGLVKLSLAGALGLIGGGAVLRRLGLRAEERALLARERNRADAEV